ncbi:MAG TPA: hypothetical protein VF210_00120 [Pseudomonadales bacterium]
MDVDIIAIGAFATIATAIWLTMWTDYRSAQEKRQRLEKFHRHP